MTDKRLSWFKCNPTNLLGALASMRAPEGYVYCIVILRIYESGGACRDSIDSLSTRTRLNKRIVSEALNSLFKAGRLYRDGDGIMNPVAAKMISETTAKHQGQILSGQKGGIRSAKIRQQNQETTSREPTVSLVANLSHLESKKEEGSKKERKNPRAARSVPLPSDWALSLTGLEFATRNGFDSQYSKTMSRSFADHHHAKGNRMVDWEAAWRTWVRNEIKFKDRRGPPPRNGAPFPSRNGAAALLFDSLTNGDEDARNDARPINR